MSTDNTPTEDVQYVAQIKIEKITKPLTSRSQMHMPASQQPKRERSEVTQMTIKASSFESLKRRLGGHIDLIEED